MFSLNIGLTQKKEVRKLSKERGNWKKFDSRLDWKKDYTPRENIIRYFVSKFKVEMWQGLENSLPEIKWQNSCKENFFCHCKQIYCHLRGNSIRIHEKVLISKISYSTNTKIFIATLLELSFWICFQNG